jgi:hypothetical protein
MYVFLDHGLLLLITVEELVQPVFGGAQLFG